MKQFLNTAIEKNWPAKEAKTTRMHLRHSGINLISSLQNDGKRCVNSFQVAFKSKPSSSIEMTVYMHTPPVIRKSRKQSKEKRSEWSCSFGCKCKPGARFLKVPKSCRTREITELFYSHLSILNMNRVTLHIRSFRRMHLSRYRFKLKMALRAREVSGDFEKRVPGRTGVNRGTTGGG